MIKGLTELCLDVFIQLISKVADDCRTFIAINFTVFVHLGSVILHLPSLSTFSVRPSNILSARMQIGGWYC